MENLDEILTLTRENNKILRGMRRAQRWTGFFQWIYWILIIGSVVGAYYYIEPLVEPLMKSYQNVVSDLQNVKSGIQNVNSSIQLPADTVNKLKDTLNNLQGQ